jgi:hypothetical protein
MAYHSQYEMSASQEERLAETLDDNFLANEWWVDEIDQAGERENSPPPILNPNDGKSDFVPLDSGIKGREGQNSKEWHDATESFKSQKVYED